jgi:hypothetical protein
VLGAESKTATRKIFGTKNDAALCDYGFGNTDEKNEEKKIIFP